LAEEFWKPKGSSVEDETAGNPRVERLGLFLVDFGWALAGGWLLFLGQDLGTDGRETLFGEVAANLAIRTTGSGRNPRS
jgi:hypothetical protein